MEPKMSDSDYIEYIVKIMDNEFDFRRDRVLHPDMYEAAVMRTRINSITSKKGDSLGRTELSNLVGAKGSKIKNRLLEAGFPKITLVPVLTTSLEMQILYNPESENSYRLGDEFGFNDWFLFEKEGRQLSEFMRQKGKVLPQNLRELITDGKAHRIEYFLEQKGYLGGLKLESLPDKELKQKFLDEGLSENTIIPVTTENFRHYNVWHPSSGEKNDKKCYTGKTTFIDSLIW